MAKGYRLMVVMVLLLSPLALRLSPLFAQTSEMEQRYNALAERFEVRDKALMRDLKTYLQAYPYTTFVDEVNFMQAVLYAEKSVYKPWTVRPSPVRTNWTTRSTADTVS